jgi:acyl CoA:acetate/3-ketoacid CoA transferase alpha subunit
MPTKTQRAFLATLIDAGGFGLPLYSIAARMGSNILRQPTVDRLVKDGLIVRVHATRVWHITEAGRLAVAE